MIKYIDLFAGMGGFRQAIENYGKSNNKKTKCVLTSEIKKHAIVAYSNNYEKIKYNNICFINEKEIEDFDILFAGIPCQPFSYAGNRLGFADKRGTLYFEVERILKEKKPKYFIIENVEGLLTNDNGRTLKVIINSLKELEYDVDYKIINSIEHGIAQSRNRIYIVGSLYNKIDLNNIKKRENKILEDILEKNKKTINSDFTNKILKYFTLEELKGKSIKDKRGGKNNIHSWDFDLRGKTNKKQKELLNIIFKERRKKKWSLEIGIKYMDGIPLTLNQIKTFIDYPNLEKDLNDLCEKRYLKLEHPKDIKNNKREYRKDLEKGYNIVTGKLSFEFSSILDSKNYSNTIVATDVSKIGVIDSGIRKLTYVELCRLFGFPENYNLDGLKENEIFDLFGNSVTVPVVEDILNLIFEEN